jgi:hypothetical protein
MFVSVLARLFSARLRGHRALRALALGSMACYAFVSLSGTFFYNAFLAVTIGICVALLRAAESDRRGTESR